MAFDAATLNLPALEKQYGLPSGLLSSVMGAESGGNPDALSPKGAVGLFQFMPESAAEYGIDPKNPQQSALGAAQMYADLSKKYNGDIPSMLAAYNWGQGNVDRHGLNNAPPETQGYIQKVMAGLGTPLPVPVSKEQPNILESALTKIGNAIVSPAQAEEMPSEPMAGNTVPPLPEGFVLNTPTPQEDVAADVAREDAENRNLVWDEKGVPSSAKNDIPPLPEGFVLKTPEAEPRKKLQAPSVVPDVAKTVASSALPVAANLGAAVIPGAAPAMLLKGLTDFAMAGGKAAGQTKTALDLYAKLTGQEPLTDEEFAQTQADIKSGESVVPDSLPAKISNAIGYPSTWAHKLQSAVGLDHEPETALGRIVGGTAEGASMGGKGNLSKLIAPMLAGTVSGEVADKADASPLVKWGAQAGSGLAAGAFHKPIGSMASKVRDVASAPVKKVVDVAKTGLGSYAEMFNKTAKSGKNTSETASTLADLETPKPVVPEAVQPVGNPPKNPPIPSADEMRAGSSAIYKEAAERGGVLPPETTNKIMDIFAGEKPKTETAAIAAKSDPVKQFHEEYSKIRDKPLTLDDVQTLDEALGDKIDSEYTLGRISKKGLKLQKAQNGFREIIDNLTNQDIRGGREGFDALNDARATWRAARKMSDVERIINRADGMDQPANAIRSGMNSLLSNPSRMRGFTEQEKAAIKTASKTGVTGGLLRLFGSRLVPIGTGVAGFVGGAGLGGIPATIATAALSNLARRGALSLQEGRTDSLRSTIAKPYDEIQARRKLVAPEVKAAQKPVVEPVAPMVATEEQLIQKKTSGPEVSAAEPVRTVFTSVATSRPRQQSQLMAARASAIESGIDPQRLVLRNHQLELTDATPAESSMVQDALNAEHQKHLNRSAAQTNRIRNELKGGGNPTNFFQEIKQAGGIKSDGGKENINNLDLRGAPPGFINNKTGMSHEDALKLAVRKRWIKDENNESGTNENELQRLYDQIERGADLHPEADARTVSESEYRGTLEDAADQYGIEHKGVSNSDLTDKLNKARTRDEAINKYHEALDDEAEVMARPYIPEEQAHDTDSIPFFDDAKNNEQNIPRDEQFALEAENAGSGKKSMANNERDSSRSREEAGQGVIPGAERISDRKLAERNMAGKSQATVAQKPADEGLFDVAGRGQGDLMDTAKEMIPKDHKLSKNQASGLWTVLDKDGNIVATDRSMAGAVSEYNRYGDKRPNKLQAEQNQEAAQTDKSFAQNPEKALFALNDAQLSYLSQKLGMKKGREETKSNFVERISSLPKSKVESAYLETIKASEQTNQPSVSLADAAKSRPGDSWVVVDKKTGKAVMETFNKKTSDAVNTEKYDVLPAKDYLTDLNKRIKENGGEQPKSKAQPNDADIVTQVMREAGKPMLDLYDKPTGWIQYEMKGRMGDPTGNIALIHPTENIRKEFTSGYPRAGAEAQAYAIDNPIEAKPTEAGELVTKPLFEKKLDRLDAESRAAEAKYKPIVEAYRAGKIGDAEYLAARRARDAALEKWHKAQIAQK